MANAVFEPKLAHGLSWAGLLSWVYRHERLRTFYRRLPVQWRRRVSEWLAAHLAERVRFTRTEMWDAEADSNEPPAAAQPAGRFGPNAGANVYGYARGQFGLAESARLYVRALLGEGYPIALQDVGLDVAHSMGDRSMDAHLGGDARHGINLIFVNPDFMDAAITKIGREKFVGRHTIACWFWELDGFPSEWLPALEQVDEILVSSRFIGDSVAQATDKPVLLAPLPLGSTPDSGLQRPDFGLREDAFVFLATFDYNSCLARKNPVAVIDAFRRAFPEGEDGVQLLVKSINGNRYPEALSGVLRAAASDGRIFVRDEVIERSHLQALQRCADAYVSLHRSEGFGLGMAECMRMGKPVIATGWSGNMEYMTPENACLVDFKMVEVGAGEYIHSHGQRWAEPDSAHAAECMRRLVDDRAYAAAIGARAASDVRAKLSPGTVASTIIGRLDSIAAGRIAMNPSDNSWRTDQP